MNCSVWMTWAALAANVVTCVTAVVAFFKWRIERQKTLNDVRAAERKKVIDEMKASGEIDLFRLKSLGIIPVEKPKRVHWKQHVKVLIVTVATIVCILILGVV